MPETATLTYKERTAAIRAACASHNPRITYAQIADRTTPKYSASYIKSILSDCKQLVEVNQDTVLDAIEGAVRVIALDRLEEKE